jgi:hypothetical protein
VSDIWSGRSSDGGAVSEADPEDVLWAGRGTPPPTRTGPTLPARIAARVALVLLLFGLPATVVWVGLDLLSVRSSLLASEAALRDVRASIGQVDVTAGAEGLELAREEIAEASRRSRRPSWTLASTFPVMGPTVEVTRDVVEVAAAAVDVAGAVVADGRELVGDGVQVEIVDGQLDLATLERTQEMIAALPIDRLVAARDALAQPGVAWLPEPIVAGRRDVLSLAEDTLGTIDRADALTEALPSLLGADGPRSYFVGLQTSAELRGTGGLIGFWGVMSVDDGQVRFGATEDYDPFDDAADPSGETRTSRINTIGLSERNPPNVDPAYYARYGFAAGARSFPNINLDPDLPTTAKAILDLYELQTGERLDGVVLLDPVGLEGLLRSTGEAVPLPDDVAGDLGVDGQLPVDGFARYITADIYETLGFDRSDDRNDALRAIGDAAFALVFDGRWDGQGMARAIVEASSERHLQVFTSYDETQSALREVGVTGDLDPPTTADLFAVTANNAVGGKQDVHLGHEMRLELALDDVRRNAAGDLSAVREVSLTTTVHNPLPTSGLDDYVIGSCYVPGQVSRCFDGQPGENRTWFSVWGSPLLEVSSFESDGGSAPNTLGATFRDLRVIDHLHVTPSEATSSFVVDGSGRTPLRQDVDSVVYEVLWWRQSKAIPDLLHVDVAPPDGWAIDRVEVVGGGSGRGMGVHGGGQELVAEVREGTARLRGTVTADTRLLVHLVGGDAAS